MVAVFSVTGAEKVNLPLASVGGGTSSGSSWIVKAWDAKLSSVNVTVMVTPGGSDTNLFVVPGVRSIHSAGPPWSGI